MSGRDVAAGVLVAAAAAAWLVGSVAGVLPARVTAILVTALGVAAALVGGWWLRRVRDPAVLRPLAVLGVLTGIAAGAAIVTGEPQALLALVALTVGLWVLATVRHASARR